MNEKEKICPKCGDSVSPKRIYQHLRYHRLAEKAAYRDSRPPWPHTLDKPASKR